MGFCIDPVVLASSNLRCSTVTEVMITVLTSKVHTFLKQVVLYTVPILSIKPLIVSKTEENHKTASCQGIINSAVSHTN